MTLSSDLIDHALSLAMATTRETMDDVTMRRIVSASYYALFHHINSEAATQIAPNVTPQTNHRIQRWFDHARMKEICGRFVNQKLDKPLLGLIGASASQELQTVCRNFIALQDARHDADYNPGYSPTSDIAVQHLVQAIEAITVWDRIRSTEEANIFVLSLLMFKNWERERT